MAIDDLVNKIVVTDQFSKIFDDYDKRVSGATANTDRFGSALGGIATVAGVTVGALAATRVALDEVTESAVNNQKQLFLVAQNAAVLNDMMGESAGTVEGWGNFVAEAGDKLRIFTDSSINTATAGVLAQNRTLKLSEEQLQQVLLRSGDLAAGQYDLAQASKEVTDAIRGEAEASEKYGLSIGETAVLNYAKSLGIVFNQLSAGEQTQFRYQMFLEQTNALQGRAAASAETLAGQEAERNRLLERQVTLLGTQLIPLKERVTELETEGVQQSSKGLILIQMATAALVGELTTAYAYIQQLGGAAQEFLAAGQAGLAAFFSGNDPALAFQATLAGNSEEIRKLAAFTRDYSDIAESAQVQAWNQLTGAGRQVIATTNNLATANDKLTTATSAAAAVADDLAKEFEKARSSQAQAARDYNRQIEDADYEHGQRVIRINQDIARAVAEAAAEAAAARAEADADLAAGLAEIERDLQAEKAKAAASTESDLARLRKDRREAERDTAREISQVNSDLQQDLAELARESGEDIAAVNQDLQQDLAELARESGEDIAAVNQDLADDLEDINYKAQQDRLSLDQDYADKRLAVEQDFANQRQAINDAYEGEYADADPFRRKIMEYNRKEALSQLDQQEAAEKAALETQKNQAITELEDRVAREAAIRAREAEQKTAEIEREATERRTALETEAAERTAALEATAAERRAALEQEAAERRAALEQKLADEIESNRQRQEELRASLAQEQAERDAAAAEARTKLEAKHAEELVQIAAQEAKKATQAQEALTREEQNYQDRLASLQRSNQIEREEISQQLGLIEAARRSSYDTQLSDAEEFMSRLRSTLSEASGTGENRQGDTLPAGNAGRGGGVNIGSMTVTVSQAAGGFAGGVQTGRSVRDALSRF